jgi:hypothetical protein
MRSLPSIRGDRDAAGSRGRKPIDLHIEQEVTHETVNLDDPVLVSGQLTHCLRKRKPDKELGLSSD